MTEYQVVECYQQKTHISLFDSKHKSIEKKSNKTTSMTCVALDDTIHHEVLKIDEIKLVGFKYHDFMQKN